MVKRIIIITILLIIFLFIIEIIKVVILNDKFGFYQIDKECIQHNDLFRLSCDSLLVLKSAYQNINGNLVLDYQFDNKYEVVQLSFKQESLSDIFTDCHIIKNAKHFEQNRFKVYMEYMFANNIDSRVYFRLINPHFENIVIKVPENSEIVYRKFSKELHYFDFDGTRFSIGNSLRDNRIVYVNETASSKSNKIELIIQKDNEVIDFFFFYKIEKLDDNPDFDVFNILKLL